MVEKICDKKTHFQCNNGTCIENVHVCNGQVDCPESEDESKEFCNQNECLIRNGDCSQICKDLQISYYCSCYPGYELVDNRTCKGICNFINCPKFIYFNENSNY